MRLLSWVWSLFSRNDRLLFSYWDGRYRRSVDALEAWRALWTDKDCDWVNDSKVASNPIKSDGSAFYGAAEVYAAEDSLRGLTRRIFGVKKWGQSINENGVVTTPGLTIDETDTLFNTFITYIADLKKKRSSSRISSPASESMEPAPLPEFADSIESSGPDSSFMSSESSAVAPIGP